MVGMNKQEIIALVDKLDSEKYDNIYSKGEAEILRKYGSNPQELGKQFLMFYRDSILLPLFADVIEENNKRISEEINR